MSACYHCDLPVAAAQRHLAVVLGEERAFCCAGCRAVAETIAAAGFARYYETRTAPAVRPLLSENPESLSGSDRGEAALALEGVRCAACLWLIESVLRSTPGVLRADVHYATRRARVRWDPAAIGLLEVIGAIRAIGYGASPYDAGRQAELERRERRATLWRLFVAGFGAMQVMMYAFPAYVGEAETLSGDTAQLMRWAGLLITAPVLVISCAPFFRGAWGELRARRLGLETPIALGLAGAFAASAWATITGVGEVYFDSVSMLAFLLLAARFAEGEVRRSAARSLDRLLRLSIPVPHSPGEKVHIAPGERIPCDGTVVEGASAADESLLTGESRPVPKRPGDEVVAGSVNLDQPLLVRATRVGADTRAAGVARLVERAGIERPRLVEAAERAARPLTLAVLALSALALYVSGPWAAVAVLVVTCPCALALASPIVLARASGLLVSRGVLLTRSRALQGLERVTDVLLDKTGTLTEGRLSISRIQLLGNEGEPRCLRVAGALEASSRHPIARAFPSSPLSAGEPRYFAGQGIEAAVEGQTYRMGTRAFCAGICSSLPEEDGSERTRVFLASSRGWLAAFELEDRLRPDAAALVSALKARRVRIHLVSGDRPAVAAAVARRVGIERSTGELGPEDKLDYIRRLQREGRVVAMLGDGINDGPVLCAADVSIALGSGADSTQLHSDIVLLGNALSEIENLIGTAKRAMTLIRQNVGWALVYNALALPVAALGLVGPLEAALGMGASSIAVLLNALRPLQDPAGTPQWKASTSSSPSPSPSYS